MNREVPPESRFLGRDPSNPEGLHWIAHVSVRGDRERPRSTWRQSAAGPTTDGAVRERGDRDRARRITRELIRFVFAKGSILRESATLDDERID